MENRLFPEFPAVDTAKWEEVINADLKGGDYTKKLVWKTLEGFDVKPYYRAEDLDSLNYLNTNPAQRPYLRGHKKDNNNWDIRQDIYQECIKTSNAIALEGIKRGVTSLGFNAKAVEKVEDLDLLLDGIDVTSIKINFREAKSFRAIIDLFVYYLKTKGIDGSKVYGSINFDPYGYALYNGDFYSTLESNYQEAIEIMNTVKANIPNFDVITVNGNMFNNAGASIVQELAFTLSSANDYLYNLTKAGIPAHSIGYRTVFSFATGSNYFMEIAKIRAARMLWTKIMEQYNPKCETAYDLFIATESSYYNKSIYDPYVNMLRTTTETMSCAIAGADSISVYPFDVAYSDTDEFSRRIANNQQILLKEESYLDKVVDPSAGSYFIENLTDSIAVAAWDIFKQIEAKGGFVVAIKEGFVQDEIEKTSKERAKDTAMRKTTILGTNQYPNLNERMADKVTSQCCCSCSKNTKIKTLCCERLSEPFEELRISVEKSGKSPKVFLLTYGNLAMRKARAGFATNFFGVAGYSIEEGTQENIPSNVDIVVLCSSDEEYLELADIVMPELKSKVKNIVVAGNPIEHVDALRAKGVTDFIHVRTNALDTLQKYNKEIL